MGRELTPHRITPLTSSGCPVVVSCGISTCFQVLSPCVGQIAHALLTRPPLESCLPSRRTSNMIPVRLACVKHAASVRPEPGSNSDVQSFSMSRAPLRCSPKHLRFPRNTAFYSQYTDCFVCLVSFIRCIVFKDRQVPHFKSSICNGSPLRGLESPSGFQPVATVSPQQHEDYSNIVEICQVILATSSRYNTNQ